MFANLPALPVAFLVAVSVRGEESCSVEGGTCRTYDPMGPLPSEFNLKPIDRVHHSQLSYLDFLQNYHMKDIPVIITNYTDGTPLRKWNLDRMKAECGSTQTHIFERIPQTISMLQGEIRRQFDDEIKQAFNMSLEEILEELRKRRPLSEFIDIIQKPNNFRPSYFHLAHYVWPMEIHDKSILTTCKPFYDDVFYPKYVPRNDYKRIELWDKAVHPRFFAAPELSRAYPTHRHGEDEHSMLLMLQGRKRYVNWRWDQAPYLYEVDLGSSSETGDTPYMANPFTNDIKKQPDLTKATGWDGIAEPGDLLYVPRGIHIVENLSAVLAVSFIHQFDEKDAQWNYEKAIEGAEKNTDTPIKTYMAQVACHTLNRCKSEHHVQSRLEKLCEDASWLLTTVDTTCSDIGF